MSLRRHNMNDYQLDSYADIKNNSYDFSHPVMDEPVNEDAITEAYNSPEHLRSFIKLAEVSRDV
jgi:hypothetical protein